MKKQIDEMNDQVSKAMRLARDMQGRTAYQHIMGAVGDSDMKITSWGELSDEHKEIFCMAVEEATRAYVETYMKELGLDE